MHLGWDHCVRVSIDPDPGLLEIAFDRVDVVARIFGHSVKNTENLVLCFCCL